MFWYLSKSDLGFLFILSFMSLPESVMSRLVTSGTLLLDIELPSAFGDIAVVEWIDASTVYPCQVLVLVGDCPRHVVVEELICTVSFLLLMLNCD